MLNVFVLFERRSKVFQNRMILIQAWFHPIFSKRLTYLFKSWNCVTRSNVNIFYCEIILIEWNYSATTCQFLTSNLFEVSISKVVIFQTLDPQRTAFSFPNPLTLSCFVQRRLMIYRLPCHDSIHSCLAFQVQNYFSPSKSFFRFKSRRVSSNKFVNSWFP